MTLKKALRGIIWGFSRDERGNIAIEAVVILPMMFWTYLALFSTFHAYRTYSVNQKAAYTIGDMISRETTPLDNSYMEGAHTLLAYLTNAPEHRTAVRVTSVRFNGDNNVYERDWSETVGNVPPASVEQVVNWKDHLPVMPHNDRVVVVETFMQYDPPFNTGLANREVRNFVFTKPRYAPQVLFAGAGS